MVIELRGFQPQISKGVFIAPTATVIGNVSIGEDSSVLYGSVLRGDVNSITIGKECNIQDLCMLHATYEKTVTVLEDRVSVGHATLLHGCFIGSGSLIGMGCILMDNVKIGKNSIVGAGSLVTEGKEFPDNSLILGRPAKLVRKLKPEEIETANKTADYYLHYKGWHEDLKILEE
ncbi:MAG: gamma carbonic anhydrase family protein [Bdellovibrionales bacterium]